MRVRGSGRILIVGSIAGFMPGTYQAVYNGTKAFIDSFSFALRAELKDSGVTVTCLMPGATETEFFARADMMDTKVGTSKKDDAADVAKVGFDAMMRGDGDVVTGFKNKIQSAVANVTPAAMLAAASWDGRAGLCEEITRFGRGAGPRSRFVGLPHAMFARTRSLDENRRPPISTAARIYRLTALDRSSIALDPAG